MISRSTFPIPIFALLLCCSSCTDRSEAGPRRGVDVDTISSDLSGPPEPELLQPPAPETYTPCPLGHSEIRVRPIRYGMPAPESITAMERGEVELAGCIVWPGSPSHGITCDSCGYRYDYGVKNPFWHRVDTAAGGFGTSLRKIVLDLPVRNVAEGLAFDVPIEIRLGMRKGAIFHRFVQAGATTDRVSYATSLSLPESSRLILDYLRANDVEGIDEIDPPRRFVGKAYRGMWRGEPIVAMAARYEPFDSTFVDRLTISLTAGPVVDRSR